MAQMGSLVEAHSHLPNVKTFNTFEKIGCGCGWHQIGDPKGPLVKRVDEMGFNRKSKMYLSAIRVLSSMNMETWELKLDVFRSLGFSENDISAVFRRAPKVFSSSKRKIKESTELLLLAGNHDISFVVDHPGLLTFSIENRVKPRLEILHILEKKEILRRKPSLTTICKMTDKQFSEKYILPYSNVLGKEVCGP